MAAGRRSRRSQDNPVSEGMPPLPSRSSSQRRGCRISNDDNNDYRQISFPDDGEDPILMESFDFLLKDPASIARVNEFRRHPERLKFSKRISKKLIMGFPLYKDWYKDRCILPVKPSESNYKSQPYHSKFKSNCAQSVRQSFAVRSANASIMTHEQEELLRKLGEPLLDVEKVRNTIKEWTAPLPSSYLTRPLVIVGPSAVGKNRLIKALLKDYSRFFAKVVTHTTRNPRPEEINGTTYHFVTKDEFQRRIDENLFLEWSTVHNNLYGVSTTSWQAAQQQDDNLIFGVIGKISILEIDIQGAKKIKVNAPKYGLAPMYVFIAPPDIDTLRERLLKRATESTEQIELRLSNAYLELEESKKTKMFDRVIVNDDLELARNKLFRAVREWYPSLPSASRIRMMMRRLKSIRTLLSGEKKVEEVSTAFDSTTTTSNDYEKKLKA